MKINLNYKFVVKGEVNVQDLPSPQEATFNYIAMAVNQKYEKGLDGHTRRMWGRIQRKFDDAIDKKSKSIDLETADQDFIKKVVSECKYHPNLARYISVLEDEIDSWDKKK